ncbi:hypothetical protein EVAR_50165_1 [Eumeta japonica]|uniref:Uncharacterized protein n=1 Tax=Eumeta variegata TaxID=151549 RepID=A0A4C1YX74_EUMVA|nr:hypothetical protein EVAR_50165_1 [Eumeta japonica]
MTDPNSFSLSRSLYAARTSPLGRLRRKLIPTGSASAPSASFKNSRPASGSPSRVVASRAAAPLGRRGSTNKNNNRNAPSEIHIFTPRSLADIKKERVSPKDLFALRHWLTPAVVFRRGAV